MVSYRLGGQAAIAGLPGVATVSEFGAGEAKVDGELTSVVPVDPATVEQDLGIASGGVAGLAAGTGVPVHEKTARAKGWTLGGVVHVERPQTGAHPPRMAGTFTRRARSAVTTWCRSRHSTPTSPTASTFTTLAVPMGRLVASIVVAAVAGVLAAVGPARQSS